MPPVAAVRISVVDPEALEHADGEGDGVEVVPLVVVEPALEDPATGAAPSVPATRLPCGRRRSGCGKCGMLA